MWIPVFSFIYLAILATIFLLSKGVKRKFISCLTLLCFLEINNFQGFFLLIGNSEQTVLRIHITVMILFSLVLLLRKQIKLKKRICVLGLLLALVPFLSMIIEVIYPYDGLIMPRSNLDNVSWDGYAFGLCTLYRYNFSITSFLSMYVQFLSYIFVFIVTKSLLSKEDYYNIIVKILKYSYIVVGYGYVELIFKNFLGCNTQVYSFTQFLFGVGKSTYTAENISLIGNFIRLQGFTREPSHYVLALLFICILILVTRKINELQIYPFTNKSKYTKLLVASLSLMPLTGGASCAWCYFVIAGAYCLIDMKGRFLSKRILKYLVSVPIVCFLFIFFAVSLLSKFNDILLINRIETMWNTFLIMITNSSIYAGASIDGSFYARFTSIIVCIGNWLDRPLFGIGIEATSAHAFTVTWLTRIGIIGVILWFKMLVNKISNNVDYHLVLLTWIIFISGIIYGLTSIWIGIIYLILSESTTLYYRKKVAFLNE